MTTAAPLARPVVRWTAPVLAAAILLLTGSAAAHAQSFSQGIRSYDVNLRIQRDGSMQVVEIIVYDFDGEAHHGIFRDIPVRFPYNDKFDRVYPLHVDAVQGSPGTPDGFKVEHSGNQLDIRIGDPKKTITGEHTYTITYTVKGALNGFADHDELYWNAIGTEWSVPIDRASVRVTVPARITGVLCFSGPYSSTLPCDRNSISGDSATFSESEMSENQAMTVVVGFHKGAVVPAPAPVLKERWAIQRAFSATPVTLSVSLLLLVLLVGGAIWLMWKRGRDLRYVGSMVDASYGKGGGPEETVPLFEHGAVPVEYAPPDGIRPGQVGTLIDEQANTLDVTATIIDLAVRGYLRIEEIPKKGWFGKPDWRLVKLKAGADLLPYERSLFDGLFETLDDSTSDEDEDEEQAELVAAEAVAQAGGQAYAGTPSAGSAPPRPDLPPMPEHVLADVKLSALRKHFAARLQKVETALYNDAVQRKWFAKRPDKVRQAWQAWAILMLIGGLTLTGVAAAWSHLGLLPLPLVVAALVLLVGAHLMPRRTARGTAMIRRVLGFKTYIETAEKQEARFQERENIFSQYLPYAVVFGCTEKWARAFRGLEDQLPQTNWYLGAYPFTVAAFTSSIDSFTVTTAGTISATPASSGSSGFGGGGFSGGGGGGGGGGAW